MLNQPAPWTAPQPRWFEKTGWIILLLVLFAPAGIFLLYRAGLWTPVTRHIVSVIAGLWFVLLVAGVAAGDPEKDEAPKPSTPASPSAPPSLSPSPSDPVSTAPTTPPPMPTPTPTPPPPPPQATTPPPAPAPAATTEPPQPPQPPTTRPTTHTPEPPAPEAVYYENCAAARAAGAAPIHEGEPGYAPHLDRDDDGVACEN